MRPELKTTLNALIVAIGFALSPVIGTAQQAPAAQSQSQSPNVQQQNSNPGQTSASQGGTVHAQPTTKTNFQGTSDRSSKPHYVPTGGGDKGGPQGARASNLIESAKTNTPEATGPAAGGGDKSIDAQGAVSLASPSFSYGGNSGPIGDSQGHISEFLTYLTTNLENRVKDACHSSPASSEEDEVDQYNCARQALEFGHGAPLETTLFNDDGYEASLIWGACVILPQGAEQAFCFQSAIQGNQSDSPSKSVALLNLITSCQNSQTPNQCYKDGVAEIVDEPATINLDNMMQLGPQK